MYSSSSPNSRLFPCTICQQPTDQTCSLCRKKFYCSQEHQQIDWHMKHKLQCEGKIIPSSSEVKQPHPTDPSAKQFKIYESGYHEREFEYRTNQVKLQNESKYFMTLFEERLILRKKSLDKYLSVSEDSSEQARNETIKNCEELVSISENILKLYRPQFTNILQELYGITTTQFLLKLDYILDRCLLARCHNKFHQQIDQIRKFLFFAFDQMPPYPQTTDSRYRQVYCDTLKSVINISEIHNNDKVTEALFAKFIKLIEKFDGIWQQLYAYFNMGSWYAKKTYFRKAIQCYQYSLEMINTHKARDSSDNSMLVKSDLIYNLSICEFSLGNQIKAVELMQDAYRFRVKAIGKNSIETSECLECLARWAYKDKNWKDCLNYAKECHRIRKANLAYPKELEKIQKLIEEIYAELRHEQQKNEEELNSKPARYYESLLSPIKVSEKEKVINNDPQESFIKQLHQEQSQQVPFKVVVTPEIADTFSSKQWQYLTEITSLTDQMMDKEEMRKIIFESEFTNSLDEEQRDVFIRQNHID